MAALVLALAHPPAVALAQSAVPVMVGGDPNDACGTSGEVVGTAPEGDGFLPVRAGPGSGHGEIDRLAPGAEVALCDEQGSWIGIVYGDGPCGTGSTIQPRQPYPGPCRSGWVLGERIGMTAG